MSETLLNVVGLHKWFRVGGGFLKPAQHVKAVNGVSFSVRTGRTLGVVGESGCGKSTLGRTVLQLIPPTAGKIYFRDRDMTRLSRAELKSARRHMQMIFQDSYASMNPRMRVGTIIQEPMKVNGIGNAAEREGRTLELLQTVGLGADAMHKYPHEFSGGQRQRIDIARALVLNPRLIVCDEPVSALDVSIQSQVINLLRELQQTLGLSYLFISHDLSVIRHISDDVAVMYLGKIVEVAPKAAFFENPRHPYARALLSAVPIPDPERTGSDIILEGDVPNPVSPPSGCCFRTRCHMAAAVCAESPPPLKPVAADHTVACHFVQPA